LTDRGARLLLAGLFGRPSGSSSKSVPKRAYFASDFLDRMHDSTPGISGAFDAVALHPYSYSYRQLAPQIEELRAVLRQHGDSEMPLWITELGCLGSSLAPHPSALAPEVFEHVAIFLVHCPQALFELLVRETGSDVFLDRDAQDL
jgi:hypothetical protein